MSLYECIKYISGMIELEKTRLGKEKVEGRIKNVEQYRYVKPPLLNAQCFTQVIL